MLSLGMDGPNVNKSIIHKINQVKKEKGYQPLVKCPPSCPIHISNNIFQKGMAQCGYYTKELCLNHLLLLQEEFMQMKRSSLKLRNHLVLKSPLVLHVMFRVCGCHLFQHCNTLSQSRMQLRCCCLETCQK